MAVKQQIEKLLNRAGLTINGPNDYDPQIFNEKLYARVLTGGSLAVGEAYMDGWWDAKHLDQFFYKIAAADLGDKFKYNWNLLRDYAGALLINQQTKMGSKKVAKEHYDLSAQLYESFLDPYNQYSCGYFKDTDSLNEAQEKKLDLICRKLQLTAKDRVLDIGCGWGGFAKYATTHYGCHVTGITISKEQVRYARQYTKRLPVKIKLLDYRDITDTYDKILSCGMMEHVGHKNYQEMMKIAHRHLADNGLFLLHTIGLNNTAVPFDPWIKKYIFPNSELPIAKHVLQSIEGLFVMEDWQNFGAYYDKTLMAWFENFDRAWPKLKEKHSEKFYRMWKYYLQSCAGAFRARKIQLWQMVLSKNGVAGGYKSVR